MTNYFNLIALWANKNLSGVSNLRKKATIKIIYLDVINKVFLNIVLEILGEEKFLSSAPGDRIRDDHGEQSGHVGHDSLQQSKGHGQEQGPGAYLKINDT